jgi:hypothetical protein
VAIIWSALSVTFEARARTGLPTGSFASSINARQAETRAAAGVDVSAAIALRVSRGSKAVKSTLGRGLATFRGRPVGRFPVATCRRLDGFLVFIVANFTFSSGSFSTKLRAR